MNLERVLDYSRCFAINTAAQNGVERNTCRTQLLARCALVDQDGVDREYFLGKECIGEYMYREEIAQVPTSEVCIIFSVEDSSLLKKFANHEADVTQAGEMMVERKGFDGTYSNWTSLQFVFRQRSARILTSEMAIIEATLAGEPLVGRTTLETPLGDEIVLEYPIPYTNVHPPESRYQVDVGPILYPGDQPEGTSIVERFQLAYVMYNRPGQAEFALRVPTAVAEHGAETMHYSSVVVSAARNELFTLGHDSEEIVDD